MKTIFMGSAGHVLACGAAGPFIAYSVDIEQEEEEEQGLKGLRAG